jgi:hypothetical protein
VNLIEETATSAPDCLDPYYAYAEAKMAELLCAISAARDGIAIPVARIFTLVVPLLPLDAHFAVGNFMRDALAGGRCASAATGRRCAPTSIPSICASGCSRCSRVVRQVAPTTSDRSGHQHKKPC